MNIVRKALTIDKSPIIDKGVGRATVHHLVDFWQHILGKVFGIKKPLVDKIDYKAVKELLGLLTEQELKELMLVMIWQYRIDEWYRSKKLVPKLVNMKKNINALKMKSMELQTQLNLWFTNEAYRENLDFLGLMPLVNIVGNRIPVGWQLLNDTKRLNSIFKIEDLRFWFVDNVGKVKEDSAVCHGSFSSDGKIAYRNNYEYCNLLEVIPDLVKQSWKLKSLLGVKEMTGVKNG